jgi:hypothetical protein
MTNAPITALEGNGRKAIASYGSIDLLQRQHHNKEPTLFDGDDSFVGNF